MSRHKLVKTMDLEDEMDDFDGGDDHDYDAGVDVNGEEGMCKNFYLSRTHGRN